MGQNIIPLWRSQALTCARPNIDHVNIPIFSSARQSLSEAVRLLGLGRAARVAIPEWSSQCVINAVAAYAMPIPLTDVLKNDIPVDAVLVYEQWGWKYNASIYDEVRSRFSDSKLIFDCVDSADLIARDWLNPQSSSEDVAVILSLSKVLGLKGGGVLRIGNEFIVPKASSPEERLLSEMLLNDSPSTAIDREVILAKVDHLLKSHISEQQPSLTEWLENNDLILALETERSERAARVSIIRNSGLANSWPAWMLNGADSGGAGICPLELRACWTQDYIGELSERFKLELKVLNFNWLGNPLKPDYKQVLALPCHGQVAKSVLIELTSELCEA